MTQVANSLINLNIPEYTHLWDFYFLIQEAFSFTFRTLRKYSQRNKREVRQSVWKSPGVETENQQSCVGFQSYLTALEICFYPSDLQFPL